MRKIKLLLATLLAIMGASSAWAQTKEAYAVWTKILGDDYSFSDLVFYYDTEKNTHHNETNPNYDPSDSENWWHEKSVRICDLNWAPGEKPRWVNWRSYRDGEVCTVKFDQSFDDYHGLTNASYMFADLSVPEDNFYFSYHIISGLQYLHTENVTDMSYMFKDIHYWQETLDLSNFNTAKVTNMAGMFQNCSSLKTIKIGPNFTTANVTNMVSMFEECSALETLDLTSFNTINVTDMTYMFNGCTSLETIYCNNDWQKDNLASFGMFQDCTSLTGAVHYNSSGANYFTASMANPTTGYFTGKAVPYALVSENGETLTFYYDTQKFSHTELTYTIPWDSEDNGWCDNRNITTVIFDESFKNYDGLESTSCMFDKMYKLTTIVGIENLNTENVTDMSCMFRQCFKITNFDFSSFNTRNVQKMNNMFEECLDLTTLDLRKFNTSNVTDMSEMFFNCEKLKSIDLSSFKTENVTDMTGMFRYCKELANLDLSGFNTENLSFTNEMFRGCEKLKAIFCGNNWNKPTFTSDASTDMFKDCSVLVGAVAYESTNANDISYANPTEGYFTYGTCVHLNDKGYATFASKTPVDFANAEGYTAWQITGVSGDVITFEQITGAVAGGTGVLLMGTADADVTIFFTTSGETLSNNKLEGCPEEKSIREGWYYGLSGDQFVPINAGRIPAGKALLPASVVNPSGGTKNLNLVFNDETGIIETRTVSGEQAEGIFNLAGQRLTKPQRGINIVNGKKVFIQR